MKNIIARPAVYNTTTIPKIWVRSSMLGCPCTNEELGKSRVCAAAGEKVFHFRMRCSEEPWELSQNADNARIPTMTSMMRVSKRIPHLQETPVTDPSHLCAQHISIRPLVAPCLNKPSAPEQRDPRTVCTCIIWKWHDLWRTSSWEFGSGGSRPSVSCLPVDPLIHHSIA